ncbi:MAG: zinc-dependent alcohol dehydrogenase family protein [Candidatus Humimicrobiaceae bacterium]
MKAAVMYKPGDVKVVDVDIPKPAKGEVLIKVKKCGVCGTDYILYKGHYYANFPIIFGHEFSGEVVGLGEDVSKFSLGDRVTVDPNIVCHNCYFCKIGEAHLCENLITLGINKNGGFAEYAVVPEENLYILPKNLTFGQGALVEPLACSIRGIEVANIKQGDTVLILGAGGMGNLIMQLALNAGASEILVSETIKERREIALEYGATKTINPNEQDVEKEIKKMKYCGADVVFECTGIGKVAESALHLARRGGHIVLFGVCPKGETIPVTPFDINENELFISGSFNNPNTQIKAIEMLASGKIKTDKLINPIFKLNDFDKVWSSFGAENTMRIMIDMG